MSQARRAPHGRPSGEALRVVRALRGYTNESEMYVAAAGREAAMHRTDLTGLALVMDRTQLGETTTPGRSAPPCSSARPRPRRCWTGSSGSATCTACPIPPTGARSWWR